MMKKYLIIFAVICITGIVFAPISNKKLESYKQKEIEYNSQKKSHEEFVQMCEEYKADYNNLSKKYDKIQEDYKLYKEEYNKDKNQKKELEELTKKKEKYINLIKEYSSGLDNL